MTQSSPMTIRLLALRRWRVAGVAACITAECSAVAAVRAAALEAFLERGQRGRAFLLRLFHQTFENAIEIEIS